MRVQLTPTITIISRTYRPMGEPKRV